MLGRFELRSILGADVDDRLRALVARALARDPSQRHPEQQPGQLVAQARPVADLMQSPEQGGWHFVASDKGGAVHGSGVPGGRGRPAVGAQCRGPASPSLCYYN